MNIQSSVQKPHGDSIDDVTRIKILFRVYFVMVFSNLMWNLQLHCRFWNFQNWRNFEIRQTFSSYMSPEVESVIPIANPMPYILSFWSTLLLQSSWNSNFSLVLESDDVIVDMIHTNIYKHAIQWYVSYVIFTSSLMMISLFVFQLSCYMFVFHL